MYEWRNAKVSGRVRKVFELATDIAWEFDDQKVRSAYVLFAAMNVPDAAISQLMGDMNMLILPDIEGILSNKDIFAKIFGNAAAEKFFPDKEKENQEEAKEETPKNSDEEFVDKVLDILEGIMHIDDDYDGEIMEPLYSDKLEKACDDAYYRCKSIGLDYIDLDVLVYSILQYKETSAYKFMTSIMESVGVSMDDFLYGLRVSSNIADGTMEATRVLQIPSNLESCLEVLNDKYQKGEEITILGRDKEIYKLLNIFSKKTKRNAVLIGLPGVGKTAIIEAITQQIVNGTCPKEFKDYLVLSLDVNAMVAGTKYRGEFETKVAVLKKFLEGTPNIILFVDEMHQMLGAGGTSDGNVDLSGSLKPILSRDDVIFVGATTIKEYEQILSRDGAFKRRFEVVNVKEPKTHEIKLMIEAKLKSMEKHHHVKMPREFLDYIILCSNCFNLDNANPDKTLDLCDRSMAIAKVEGKKAVTKTCINKVYEEYFEKYAKIELKDLKATAYHEVGHYIVTRLTKENKASKVIAVSIVPTEDFVGVNILEDTERVVSCDKEYVDSYLMSLLAGRVAQFKVSKAIDSGASNDLMRAKKFARSVIAEYGMDEGEYQNIYLLDDKLLNEKITAIINEKASNLIKEAYKKAEVFIEEHWEEIDKMAKYLMKKKIVTSAELDKFLKK